MSNPIKNPTTYKQQLDKLKLRGCITKNDAFCMSVLKAVNYYRLSAYFLPFKNNDDTYVKGRYNFGSRNMAASLTVEFAVRQTSLIYVHAFRAPIRSPPKLIFCSAVEF